MKKILFILLLASFHAFGDFEIWNSSGDQSIKFYLDLEILSTESEEAVELIEEMVIFIKKTERDTKLYEYYISKDKKRISLTEHYKNDTAALKHVLNFQNGPYQETFFKLMKVNSFQVMGPVSEELINSLEGLTDDFRIKVDGFKRNN